MCRILFGVNQEYAGRVLMPISRVELSMRNDVGEAVLHEKLQLALKEGDPLEDKLSGNDVVDVAVSEEIQAEMEEEDQSLVGTEIQWTQLHWMFTCSFIREILTQNGVLVSRRRTCSILACLTNRQPESETGHHPKLPSYRIRRFLSLRLMTTRF